MPQTHDPIDTTARPPRVLPKPSPLAEHWPLDPDVVPLNHGSYGAVPTAILEAQHAYEREIEQDAMRFFVDHYLPRLNDARARVADFVGTPRDSLIFAKNSSQAVATVMQHLVGTGRVGEGDQLLINDHEYASCKFLFDRIAKRTGAEVVVAKIPFPIASADEAYNAIMRCVTPRTKICLLSWITSNSALRLPIKQLVSDLQARGIDCIVDGAHAPGQCSMRVDEINAAYTCGNLHKWTCGPKGSAYLCVRHDRQEGFEPWMLSAWADKSAVDREPFQMLFDYMGTDDISAWLAATDAIDHVGAMHADGWAGIRKHNHDMLLAGHDLLCDELGLEPAAPDDMLGCIATLVLPGEFPPEMKGRTDPFYNAIHDDWRIRVPIVRLSPTGPRLLRISAFLYNTPEQYSYLAEALKAELPKLQS